MRGLEIALNLLSLGITESWPVFLANLFLQQAPEIVVGLTAILALGGAALLIIDIAGHALHARWVAR